MFSKEQLDDIIENQRADVAEELLTQLEDALDAVEARMKMYEAASIPQLKDLAENGDSEACAYYVSKRIKENTLVADDMKYLENAIADLNEHAAAIGAWVYGIKNGRYEDKEKELFSLAVGEQNNNGNAHKLLTKAYKKHAEIIDEADKVLLQRILDVWSAEALRASTFDCFTAEIKRLEKDDGFPDYKSAWSLEIYLTEQNGRNTDTEALYVRYMRGKNIAADKQRFCDEVAEIVGDLAAIAHIKSGDVYLDGKRYYHYGGSAVKHGDKKSADKIEILASENPDIDISDEGRLKSNVCAYCGGAIDLGGVCSACGKSAEYASDDKIVIRKGKTTEALLCTQCGSPVKLDENGKTAFCSACGTTFAVNGSALTDGIPGLNYENLKADMPEGAELPKVEFVRASIADGNLTAVMPRNFIVMSDEMRRIKYPVNPPKYIYTTPDSTINLNIGFTTPLAEKDVFTMGPQLLAMLKGVFPTAKFGEARKLTSPQNIFIIEFITAAADQTVYNAMFLFSHNGRQGLGSWNCLGKDRWFWAPVFEHAIKTMTFKKN